MVVTAGQQVKEGDHLLTLEAMKMNTFVFAPRAGKVAEVKVAVGAAVEEGQSLVRIENSRTQLRWLLSTHQPIPRTELADER